jgi:hypothetical protein
MCRLFLTSLVSLIVPAASLLAQSSYQVRYAANLNRFESIIDLVNAGANTPSGYLCANVYAYDPGEELIACCTCPISANGNAYLLVNRDIVANRLTPAPVTSLTIKLLATAPSPGCDPTSSSAPLATGMAAWGTTTHLIPSTVTTETPFTGVALTSTERTRLAGDCSAIFRVGSGYGICPGCTAGSLAVPRQ